MRLALTGLLFAVTLQAQSLTERLGEVLDHPPLDHIPHLYYCDPLEGKDAFGRAIPAGVKVDVSSVIETKAKALEAHHSQRAWMLKHHGVDEFVESMKKWGRVQGQSTGLAYAEGFRQHLGHSYPQDNLLGAILGTVGLQTIKEPRTK